MSYTDQSSIESYLGESIPTANQSFLATIISAVKLYIDKYCGKTFESTGSLTKYYDVEKDNCDLFVDSFFGTPTITLLDSQGDDSRVLDSDDYILYPLNTTEKNRIHLLNADDFWLDGIYGFGAQHRRVKIVATFGIQSTVPDDIKVVATQLASNMYWTGATNGDITSETLGDYSVSYGSVGGSDKLMTANMILDGYRDIDI